MTLFVIEMKLSVCLLVASIYLIAVWIVCARECVLLLFLLCELSHQFYVSVAWQFVAVTSASSLQYQCVQSLQWLCISMHKNLLWLYVLYASGHSILLLLQ